ncbi:acetolactate decarboxylase [Methanolobus sp. WCC4]|uniref:acetolactate decarboxylase n=1 Tax=Methanolobus sp. WCC4 TaxID=3125784 RepID=UPI0030FAB0EA
MRTLDIVIILIVITLGTIACGCINEQAEEDRTVEDISETTEQVMSGGTDTIYQFSIINALLEGVYDGEVSSAELKEHGDFGLGTFDDLDGEMLELDGVIYQVKADGNVYEVDDTTTSPFAVVTFFETDIEDIFSEQMDNQQMAEHIADLLPSENIMYAIKITGNLSYLKTRSVAAQEKPYPRLVDVTKDQSVFEFNDTRGTIVGYWMPEYIDGINVPGYHLHFITEDRTGGGHILEYTIDSGIIEIDSTDGFYLELPENENYLGTGFSQDTEGELEEAEN